MKEQNRITRVIQVLLSGILGIFVIIVALNLLNLVILMINPEAKTNIYTMGQLHLLDNPELERKHKIEKLDQKVFDEQYVTTGIVLFKSTNRIALFIGVALWTAWFSLYALVIYLLLRFLKSVKNGTPFIAENATRIKRMGLSIICAELARLVLTLLGIIYLLSAVDVEGAHPFFPWEDMIRFLNIEVYFGGFVLIILSQIFKQGTLLKEEQDLTI